MKIIISPAMNMQPLACITPPKTLPRLLEDTKKIGHVLASYSPWDLAMLMSLNEKLANDSFDRNQHLRFDKKGWSAVELYQGLVFKYMNPLDFSETDKTFANEHLSILSGLYGILRPYDSIYEYRLEMQNKIAVDDSKNLYAYWGDKLYQELNKQSGPFINLASDEYSKCIRKYLNDSDEFITCTFKVMHKGRYKTLATAAKMARGQMTSFIIKNQITNPEHLKTFTIDGYQYEAALSAKNNFVFLKDSL